MEIVLYLQNPKLFHFICAGENRELIEIRQWLLWGENRVRDGERWISTFSFSGCILCAHRTVLKIWRIINIIKHFLYYQKWHVPPAESSLLTTGVIFNPIVLSFSYSPRNKHFFSQPPVTKTASEDTITLTSGNQHQSTPSLFPPAIIYLAFYYQEGLYLGKAYPWCEMWEMIGTRRDYQHILSTSHAVPGESMGCEEDYLV